MITIWRWQSFLSKLAISLFFLLVCSKAEGLPLPSQTVTQNKGLMLGMGFGASTHSNCKVLRTWTSNVNYSYNSLISGGASIRFLGGNLDSANNLINQRYSINAKLTFDKQKYALFIGPMFSFEKIDLNYLRNIFSNNKPKEEVILEEENTECRNLFEKFDSNIGYHSGGSILLTQDIAFNVGHSLYFTFDGVYTLSFSSAIAFNLRHQFEKLMNNTKNFWLSLEYLINSGKKENSIHNFILGFSLGF